MDTFGHIWKFNGGLHIPNMLRLGWGNIEGILDGQLKVEDPIGSFGRMAEASKGKDTTTGHWEMAGVTVKTPFPLYPDGFPKEVMDAFEAAMVSEQDNSIPEDVLDDLANHPIEIPEWDEYEQSILKKVADEIKIGIRGNTVDMTVEKRF